MYNARDSLDREMRVKDIVLDSWYNGHKHTSVYVCTQKPTQIT